MTKTFTILSVLALLLAGQARADEDCFVPMANWKPREAVAQLAKQKGWTLRRIKVDDGCYEIDGKDSTGRRLEATIHPATLQVLGIEYRDQKSDGNHEEDDD